MRLENWSVRSLSDPYTPPECRRQALHGRVYGHHRFEDGVEVTTSDITVVELVEGRLVVWTRSGSAYQLGEIDACYQGFCPDAVDRLVKWAGATGK